MIDPRCANIDQTTGFRCTNVFGRPIPVSIDGVEADPIVLCSSHDQPDIVLIEDHKIIRSDP